jgi:hypothetical protein
LGGSGTEENQSLPLNWDNIDLSFLQLDLPQTTPDPYLPVASPTQVNDIDRATQEHL